MSSEHHNTEDTFQTLGQQWLGIPFSTDSPVLTVYDFLQISVLLNTLSLCRQSAENYQLALALSFSLDEVNRDHNLLTNMSLVFYTQASHCKNVSQSENCFQSSFTAHNMSPNYKCQTWKACYVVISGPNWVVSSKESKDMDFYASHQVRFCVV